MRSATIWLTILLSIQLALLAIGTAAWSAESGSAATDAGDARTELYDNFDPKKLGQKHLSRFGRHPEFSAVSDFKFTPPGHWFKIFRIKGNISADELKQLVDSLERELKQLAKESSVEVIATKDDIAERPIALLKVLCPTYTVKVSTLQGRHISYRHEATLGDIDLFVFQFVGDDGDALRWCVLCTVHEAEIAQ